MRRNARRLATVLTLTLLVSACGSDGGLDSNAAEVLIDAGGNPVTAAENAEDSQEAQAAPESDANQQETTQTQPPAAEETATTTLAQSTTVAGPPPDRVGENIRFDGSVNIDLDSTEADWGLSTPAGHDIMWNGAFARYQTAGQIVATSGEPNLAACSDPTQQRWVQRLPVGDVEVGKSFCMQTGGGGWAWVTFKEYDPTGENGGLTIVDIIYWSE